jgi:hypothetical protein
VVIPLLQPHQKVNKKQEVNIHQKYTLFPPWFKGRHPAYPTRLSRKKIPMKWPELGKLWPPAQYLFHSAVVCEHLCLQLWQDSRPGDSWSGKMS